MARSKSISGNKADRATNPAVASAAVVPDGKTIAETISNKANAEPIKFEPKKAENRTNVVPINVEEEIRTRAYELYEKRGRISGHEHEDWRTAEEEIMRRYRQQSA